MIISLIKIYHSSLPSNSKINKITLLLTLFLMDSNYYPKKISNYLTSLKDSKNIITKSKITCIFSIKHPLNAILSSRKLAPVHFINLNNKIMCSILNSILLIKEGLRYLFNNNQLKINYNQKLYKVYNDISIKNIIKNKIINQVQ
jgi:hypothetical protein